MWTLNFVSFKRYSAVATPCLFILLRMHIICKQDIVGECPKLLKPITFSVSATPAKDCKDGEAGTYNDWVFINYTFKRFEGLTQRGPIPKNK